MLFPPTFRRQAAREPQECKNPRCRNMDDANASGFCGKCEDVAKVSIRWGCLSILMYWWGLSKNQFRELCRQVQNKSGRN